MIKWVHERREEDGHGESSVDAWSGIAVGWFASASCVLDVRMERFLRVTTMRPVRLAILSGTPNRTTPLLTPRRRAGRSRWKEEYDERDRDECWCETGVHG